MPNKTPHHNHEVSKSTSGTLAMHGQDGEGSHAVGIWDLHVYIVPDGDGWFAQGIEIDYAVQGDSVEEAKKNFEEGLEGTIDIHLKMDGNINGLLTFAPMETIQEALQNRLRGSIKSYSQFSFHDVKSAKSSLPFDGISYLVASAAA
jgi:predicted RNase H-like HicB family nuclease